MSCRCLSAGVMGWLFRQGKGGAGWKLPVDAKMKDGLPSSSWVEPTVAKKLPCEIYFWILAQNLQSNSVEALLSATELDESTSNSLPHGHNRSLFCLDVNKTHGPGRSATPIARCRLLIL